VIIVSRDPLLRMDDGCLTAIEAGAHDLNCPPLHGGSADGVVGSGQEIASDARRLIGASHRFGSVVWSGQGQGGVNTFGNDGPRPT
jgi:hypothetical protein